MKIDIIGANTKDGINLRNRLISISNNIDDKVTINLIYNSDIPELPLLYIDDKLFSKGKVPRNKDIVKYIKKNYKD